MRYGSHEPTLDFDGSDMNVDLFDSQLGFDSVKHESDLPFVDDAFDFINYTSCSNSELVASLSEPTNTRASITSSSPGLVHQTPPKHSILLQQLQEDAKQPDDILVQLLREASSSGIQSSGSILQHELDRTEPRVDVSPQTTLQLLTKAGIQQPGKRQIQLHSELARHLTSQLVRATASHQDQQQQQQQPVQPSAKVQLPVQIRLASKSTPTTAPVMSQIITAPQKSQKIIVQQIQQHQQPQLQSLPQSSSSSSSPSPSTVYLPQQIIITSQPQQPVQQQPPAINLQQLQVCQQLYHTVLENLYSTSSGTNSPRLLHMMTPWKGM